MNTISPGVTIVSAILIVVVLAIAFSLRGKIKKNESGNEFFPWDRKERMELPEEMEVDAGADDMNEDDEGEDEDDENN